MLEPDGLQRKFCLLQPSPRARLSGRRRRKRQERHRIINDNGFKPLSDGELDQLDSDELIAYIRRADEAGRAKEAQRALAILVFRHYGDVTRRVKIKVPERDVEDVAMEVITSAIKSAFDGTAVGQFRAWLNTIVKYRIADYTEKATKRKERETKLPDEHSEAEDIWGFAAVTPGEGSAVAVEQIAETVLDGLSTPHLRVVQHYVFDDMSAQETADAVNESLADQLEKPMSVDNVHQIATRFRRELRGRLDASEG